MVVCMTTGRFQSKFKNEEGKEPIYLSKSDIVTIIRFFKRQGVLPRFRFSEKKMQEKDIDNAYKVLSEKSHRIRMAEQVMYWFEVIHTLMMQYETVSSSNDELIETIQKYLNANRDLHFHRCVTPDYKPVKYLLKKDSKFTDAIETSAFDSKKARRVAKKYFLNLNRLLVHNEYEFELGKTDQAIQKLQKDGYDVSDPESAIDELTEMVNNAAVIDVNQARKDIEEHTDLSVEVIPAGDNYSDVQSLRLYIDLTGSEDQYENVKEALKIANMYAHGGLMIFSVYTNQDNPFWLECPDADSDPYEAYMNNFDMVYDSIQIAEGPSLKIESNLENNPSRSDTPEID